MVSVTPWSCAIQGNHTLVTGGYDGLIVVWNTDSGAMSARLAPPSLNQTGLQERSVEQVSSPPDNSMSPLVSVLPSVRLSMYSCT